MFVVYTLYTCTVFAIGLQLLSRCVPIVLGLPIRSTVFPIRFQVFPIWFRCARRFYICKIPVITQGWATRKLLLNNEDTRDMFLIRQHQAWPYEQHDKGVGPTWKGRLQTHAQMHRPNIHKEHIWKPSCNNCAISVCTESIYWHISLGGSTCNPGWRGGVAGTATWGRAEQSHVGKK